MRECTSYSSLKIELVRNYTVALDQKNKKGFMNKSPMTADNFPAGSYVIESKDGKSVNWVMRWSKRLIRPRRIIRAEILQPPPLLIHHFISTGRLTLRAELHRNSKRWAMTKKQILPPWQVQYGEDRWLSIFFSETEKSDKLLVSRLRNRWITAENTRRMINCEAWKEKAQHAF